MLKPGGRLAVSDILAKKEFTEELKRDMGLYVGCISGASLVSEYEGWLKDLGFKGLEPASSLCYSKHCSPKADILIVDKKSDLNIYKERNQSGEESCCGTAESEPASSCCAPSASCCSTSNSAKMSSEKADLAKRVANIDFNEWVSTSSPVPKISLRAVTFVLGSFTIYAIKPASST